MGFLDSLFHKKKEKKFEDTKAEKQKVVDSLTKRLEKLNFTKLEIKEILDIISIAEADIEILKEGLAGIEIDMENPSPVLKKILAETKQRQEEMSLELQKKIAEIRKRKEAFKKELR